MTSALDACRRQYEADLAWQTSCCALQSITAAHRAANRRVFEQLASYQRDLDANGRLPYDVHDKARTVIRRDSDAPAYPDDLRVTHPRQLRCILPIPDVHKHSDCDLIYRFLIARRMNEVHAVHDLLHYIAFREKYALDTIVWDHEVESLVNGLDGEELLQVLMNDMAAKQQHNKTSSSSSSSGSKKQAVVPLPRPLLQPGWAAWNCGVDRQGNVLCYQRPSPRDLALLLRRWPYVAGQFDRRDAESYTSTPPYCNLLVRLYLRGIEKGRRLSLLIRPHNSTAAAAAAASTSDGTAASDAASCLPLLAAAGAIDRNAATATSSSSSQQQRQGAVTCLIDVGAVKLSHLTSSKYKPAVRLMRLVFALSQVFYPENLSRLIIVNGGVIFGFVYKLVRSLLDTQTQRKIVLLSETHTASVDELKDVASPQMAERESPDGGGGNDDDDDDDDEDGGGDADNNNNNRQQQQNNTNNSSSSSALHKALLTYMDDRFVPALYGGRLPSLDAPICYGGAVPRALSSRAHFAEAAARLSAKVVPELLPDEFLFQHASEGAAVTAAERAAFAQLLRARLAGKAYTA